MDATVILIAAVLGVWFGAAIQRALDRRVKGGRGQAVPHTPLTRGSLAGECQREQAWAWVARLRDPLDQLATRMAMDPEFQENDTLTLIGLAVRVCVNESDHRRKESEEIVG